MKSSTAAFGDLNCASIAREVPRHARMHTTRMASGSLTETVQPEERIAIRSGKEKGNIVSRNRPRTLHLTTPDSRPKPEDVFVCEEETLFYSNCLQELVLQRSTSDSQVIEFGTGDGTAVLRAILASSSCNASVQGFEINTQAAALANRNIAKMGLQSHYKVHNSCFFKGVDRIRATSLISNPPYLPAPDDDILMPALFGGTDGGQLTRDLISLGMTEIMMLIPSYSDPQKTMQHARDEGYIVQDFLATKMPFGTYSSQPKVLEWIAQMKEDGKAYFNAENYQLLGVLFRKAATTGQQSYDRFDDALSHLTTN